MVVSKESKYWTVIGEAIGVDFKLNVLFLCSTETAIYYFCEY